MSIPEQAFESVPDLTARVTRAAFPTPTLAMQMRDTLDGVYRQADFADLYHRRGRPAEAPWRLARVTVLQFVAGLPDRQAADAVRGRLDWKYLLGLELTDDGVHSSVVSQFRARRLAGRAEARLLDRLLADLRQRRRLTARGRQRTDSTHVLGAVRTLTRLTKVGETLRAALTSLAVVAPDWLRAWVPPEWVDRYGPRVEDYRLPRGAAERQAVATTSGADGHRLLAAVDAPDAPAWLAQVPAIDVRRRVWVQQVYAPDEPGQVRWREAPDLPPAGPAIDSPDAAEARTATKRQMTWVGYQVHGTETGAPDWPHLITQVETTPAPQPDRQALAAIPAELAATDRVPGVQIVDAGSVDGGTLVASQTQQQVDLLGPAPAATRWPARAGQGFAATDCRVDWDAQMATCPAGVTSQRGTATADKRGQAIVDVAFPRAACTAGAQRPQCTRAATGARVLERRPQAAHAALAAARARQTTAAFREQDRARAGIEGTLSQGVRAFEVRRTRYVGLAKTHLHHVLTAVALTLVRVVAWLEERPCAQTRTSPFAKLAPASVGQPVS